MKPMIYRTPYGIAEIVEYGDMQMAVYDNEDIPPVILEDDGAFATWVFELGARYVGNFRKGEPGRPVNE